MSKNNEVSKITSKEVAESLFKAKAKITEKYGIVAEYEDIKIDKVENSRIIFKYKSDIVLIMDRKQEENMLKQIKKIQPESFTMGALTGSTILSVGGLVDGIITDDPFSAGVSLVVGLVALGGSALASKVCLGKGLAGLKDSIIDTWGRVGGNK